MSEEAELLPGTLDLLILKAVSLGPFHGYAVLSRIEQISGKRCSVEQEPCTGPCSGSCARDCSRRERGKSENNSRAKFYELTAKGRKRLREETDWWKRAAAAVTAALAARPQQA